MKMQRIFCINFFCFVLFIHKVDSAGNSKSDFKIQVEHKPPECELESAVGDNVEIHYTGTLGNGQIFDSSKQRNRGPIAITLGSGQVIEGWEKGLLEMCVGEKRILVIPSRMGYGDVGYPPVIPGDATLTFEVEMVSLKKASHIVFISSFSGLLRLMLLPAILVIVLSVMYLRYRKEEESKAEKKKKNKKRR